MILAQVMLTACLGFTGAKCDLSFPADVCGVRHAMRYDHEGPLRIDVRGGLIVMGDHWCDDPEFDRAFNRAYLANGENFLPWHQTYHWSIPPVVAK